VVLNDGASVTGNVVANGTLRFNQTAATTMSRQLSGTGVLSVVNTGTLIIHDSRTNPPTLYSDLRISVASGGLTVGASGTAPFNIGISGTGTLDVAGGRVASGETYIGGFFSNQSTGTATIRGGRWDVGSLSVGGNPNSNFAGRGTLSISGTGVVAVASTLSRGAYGDIIVSPGGSLQIGVSGTTGVLSPDTFTTNGTLAFNRSDSVTYAGAISGSGGVVQMGSGTLTLTGSHTYSGPTRVQAGNFVLAGSNSTRTLIAKDGQLTLKTPLSFNRGDTAGWTTDNLSISRGGTVAIDASQFSDSSVTLLSSIGTGTSGFMDGSWLRLDTSNVLSGTYTCVNGINSPNAMGIIKSGPGTLVLLGASKYAGGTVVESGTLRVGNFPKVSTATWNPGNTLNNGVLRYSLSSSSTWTGNITGTGSVVQDGGYLAFTGSNSYTGPTSALGGELQLRNRLAIYGGDREKWTAANLAVARYATLCITLGGTNGFTSDDVSKITTAGFAADSQLVLETPRVDSGTFVLQAGLGGLPKVVSLQKRGLGTLVIAGSSSYEGSTFTSGLFQIGDGSTNGSWRGPIRGEAVIFDRSDASAYSSTLDLLGQSQPSGGRNYAFMKRGSGTLTLSGTVLAQEDAYLDAGSVVLSSGGMLSVKGFGKQLLLGCGGGKAGELAVRGGTALIGRTQVGNDGGRGAINVESGTMSGVDGGRAVIWAYNGEVNVSNGQLNASLTLASTNARLNVYGGDFYGPAFVYGLADISGGRWLVAEDTVASTVGSGGRLTIRGTGGVISSGSIECLAGGVVVISERGLLDVKRITNHGTLTFEPLVATSNTSFIRGSGAVLKRGGGTLTLAGANTISGSTVIEQGTLQLANSAALTASTILPLAGGRLTLTPGLKTTIGGLSPNAGGLVDVGTGMVTVARGLSVFDLATALQSGRGDGSWNGSSGITSSAVAASNGSRTVGWLDNDNGSVMFGYAATGDTNLDWVIDILDVANFVGSGKFNSGLTATWAEGDFNYDGFADILDMADFMSTGLFNAAPYNTPAGSIAAVPEPSTLGMVGIGFGLAGFVAMRQKRAA
jgi:autotransporter-associated beta strand protein